MLEALGFICARSSPDNASERSIFRELVAHGKVVRHAASLSREQSAVAPTRSSPSRVRRFNAAVTAAV